MGRFKSKLDTVRQTYRLCRLGGMPEPAWLDTFLKVNKLGTFTPGHPAKVPKIRRIVFPEDRLIQSYYDRHPEARFQPIDLGSFYPPPAKRLALRQLQLMEHGVPRRKAQRVVEEHMKEAGELTAGERPSVLKQIQAEEERVLLEAIQERRQERQQRMNDGNTDPFARL